MKNYFKRTVAMLAIGGLVGLVGLSGCGDDEPDPFNSTYLVSGTGEWRLTAEQTTAMGQTVDTYVDLPACWQDDIYYFGEDGTYEHRAGTTKCEVSEPDVLESGTWDIIGTHLISEITGEDPVSGTIKHLDETTLKVSINFEFGGVNTTITGTYTKVQ